MTSGTILAEVCKTHVFKLQTIRTINQQQHDIINSKHYNIIWRIYSPSTQKQQLLNSNKKQTKVHKPKPHT